MENEDIVLVTGGSGFVGLHIIVQLLQKGYQVRTTVRSLRKGKEKIIETLKVIGISAIDKLSFIEAELASDYNWEKAMHGCRYVISVASPVFFEIPKDENTAIRPALEGILRVLKFARNSGVKRVVMTSNFGAVGFSQNDKSRETTEADWTDVNLKGLSVYEKSKLLAERAAWGFIEKEGGGLELATINPVAIFGPSLNGHISGSFHLLTNLFEGAMKLVPDIPLNVVDVRDVADLHIRAMIIPEAKGQRFIATADGQIKLPEIAALIKREMPGVAQKVSTSRLPDLLIKIGALINARAAEGAMFLTMNRNVSNAKAKTVLNWKPISSQEETILTSIESLIKFKLINNK